MKATNPESGNTYDSWDDLLKAETNGWVLVAVSERPGTVPFVVGPFDDKDEAKRVRARRRPKWAQQEKPFKIHTYVRSLWKETSI